MKVKQINNIEIHSLGANARFQCRHGRVILEEFSHLNDAERWAKGTLDFVVEGHYEGVVEVCCHRVTFCYWNGLKMRKMTPLLMETLEEHVEERATHCIIDGCSSGDLNCVVGQKYEEIRGWWEIERG